MNDATAHAMSRDATTVSSTEGVSGVTSRARTTAPGPDNVREPAPVTAPGQRDQVPWSDAEVVLVSYRSRAHVEALLQLWPAQVPVVIVDNAGGADGLAAVAAARPLTRYVDGGGQGFARAANLGAASSRADYLVFVNPDSRPSAQDLMALVQGVHGDPISISHAATVTGTAGDVEIGVGGWEPTPLRTLAYAVGLHKLFPRIGVYAKPGLGEKLDVEWTTGACMAVRAGQFHRLGGFDESFFVYNEDMSFGRRARAQGLRQLLRPDVVVRHGAGGSGAPSQEMLRLRGASFANYVTRYHSQSSAGVMRLALVLGYALRSTAQRAQGNADLAAQYAAVVKGVVSRRAFVAGTEVALARFEQTAGPATIRPAPARTRS